MRRSLYFASVLMSVVASAPSSFAQNWSNAGGNASRNGNTPLAAPGGADLFWSGGRTSIIAWQPVIEGSRVFLVRQSSFPPESTRSPVVALNLETGAELWAINIPANAGDWTTWVAGVKNGRVYASRSGNGASVSARLHCLDAASGTTLWQSTDLINAGAYDGVVFADNGDPIIASFTTIKRIRAVDGTTAWTSPRVCSVSGNCGGAIFAGAVYVADAVVGGHAIKKYDLSTGAFLYQGSLMPGFLPQNTPLVGPDGTIYLNRVQNNATVDYFYAFEDTGTGIVEKWHFESKYTYAAEFAASADSVFVVARDNSIRRLRSADGVEVGSTGVLGTPLSAVRMAIDSAGRLLVSNGEFAQGRFYCFNPDLSERWAVPVVNINIGAPAIGPVGTLVVAGVGSTVRAYRSPTCTADFNGDGTLDFFDYDDFAGCFEGLACPPGSGGADYNDDGSIDFFDYDDFVGAFETGC
jgi:hypothetical protein